MPGGALALDARLSGGLGELRRLDERRCLGLGARHVRRGVRRSPLASGVDERRDAVGREQLRPPAGDRRLVGFAFSATDEAQASRAGELNGRLGGWLFRRGVGQDYRRYYEPPDPGPRG